MVTLGNCVVELMDPSYITGLSFYNMLVSSSGGQGQNGGGEEARVYEGIFEEGPTMLKRLNNLYHI